MVDRIESDLCSQERNNRIAMEIFSKTLLKRLWEQHRYQMLYAIEQGRKVERYD